MQGEKLILYLTLLYYSHFEQESIQRAKRMDSWVVQQISFWYTVNKVCSHSFSQSVSGTRRQIIMAKPYLVLVSHPTNRPSHFTSIHLMLRSYSFVQQPFMSLGKTSGNCRQGD
jgi:hypothetical protein